jgi:hypothetical protein
MKELSVNAGECLNEYLQKVRTRLIGAKTLDPVEIERDIYEHIERELESEQEPVNCAQVEQVLERLGAPEQWVPDEELRWWRKIFVRLQDGPDDWRLAYICFAVFVLGLIVLPIGIFLLIPLSFYIGRSALSLAGGCEQLGEQKRLIYPPLVVFYALAGLVTAFWPLVICGMLHDDVWWFVVAGLGLWWLVLGAFLSARQTLIDKLVYPFGSFVSKKKLRRLMGFGGIMLLVGIVLGFFVAQMSS